MIKEAINELLVNKINLKGIVNSYCISDSTYIENDCLYYKSISEGLMFLINYKHGTTLHFSNKLDIFGTMIDVSRGAVFNVEYIKKLIRTKSLMGVNELWIYMEDIYQIEKFPLFGYMRGSYSFEEINEIVTYAKIFGIEIIPAIQTLGHMEQFLRWLAQTAKFKDQPNVLLARNNDVKDLIFQMLKTIKEMFKTTKIHIGLDETWGFGFGQFYKKNGYIPQIEIFIEHLNIVSNMAKDLGFEKILVWSDMFFRFFSEKNSYYDPNIIINNSITEKIPSNISLVYWDYYNENYELVKKMLDNHLKITNKVIFASGTWIWTRFTYDKAKTDKYIKTHLNSTFDSGVKEFILTQWMDDGAYGDHFSTMLGVFETSFLALTNDKINPLVYEDIVKENYEISVKRALLNSTKISQQALLWDDPQFSVYLNSFTNNEIEKFDELIIEQKELLNKLNYNDYLFEYSIARINYYKILGKKEMLIGIKNGIIEIDNIYNEIVKYTEILINIYRDKWYENYKMYGFEIIQSRLFQQIGRAKEIIILSEMFNNKKIKKIDGLLDTVAIYNEYLYEKHSLIAFTTKPS